MPGNSPSNVESRGVQLGSKDLEQKTEEKQVDQEIKTVKKHMQKWSLERDLGMGGTE